MAGEEEAGPGMLGGAGDRNVTYVRIPNGQVCVFLPKVFGDCRCEGFWSGIKSGRQNGEEFCESSGAKSKGETYGNLMKNSRFILAFPFGRAIMKFRKAVFSFHHR